MANLNGECCDDTATVVRPPFSDLRGGRKKRGLQIFDGVQDPIPGEITDDEDLQKVFAGLKLVPYATRQGATGHKLLYWHLMLAKLSPMHAACIQKVKKYIVGGRAKFIRAEDPEYDIEEEDKPMTTAESKAYKEAISKNIVFEGGIKSFHQRLLWQLKATGNCWAELAVSKVNGETRAVLKVRRTTDVLYLKTSADEPRQVAISPVWQWEYVKKNPPKVVPLAPNFISDTDGTVRTMFHLTEGDAKWYGRPDSEGADLQKYREVQDSVYLIRQSAGNFVGQLIIEVEDDDPGASPAIDDEDAKRSGFSSFADRMTENYTHKGEDPQTVMVTARPAGSRPMFVFQVKPNTNESWYKVTGEMAEQKILRAHGLTLRFMGFDASNGFSTDAFVADYVMNVEPVLNELRSKLMTFTNGILSTAWDLLGLSEMNQYSVTFESPIGSQIEMYKNAQNQPVNDGKQSTDNTL